MVEENDSFSESDPFTPTDSEPEIPFLSEFGKRSHRKQCGTSKRLHMTDDTHDSMDEIMSTLGRTTPRSTPRRKDDGLNSKHATPLSTPGNKENRRLTPNIKGSHGKSPVQKSSFNLTPSRIVNQKSSRQLASSADASDSTSSQQVPPEQPNLVATLSNMTTILDAVVKRMDSLENKFSQFNSAASSSSASERKSSVPLVVKVSGLFFLDSNCIVHVHVVRGSKNV